MGEVVEFLRNSRAVKAGIALGLVTTLTACSNGAKQSKENQGPGSEMVNVGYDIAATPFNQRPQRIVHMNKLLSPIVPICYEESATLAVDSVLSRISLYPKVPGAAVVAYVRSYEFPEINGPGLPRCTDTDRAQINMDSELPANK